MNISNLGYSILESDTAEGQMRINFSKHLSKKEKKLFHYLKDESVNYISLEKIYELCDFTTVTEVVNFLNNLKNKSIILRSSSKDCYVYLSIIQSFYINKNIIYLTFSREISEAMEKHSPFEKMGLDSIIFLEEKFSYRVYQYICSNKNREMYISIENLRNILEIKDSYKRFYDLEKNFLIPIFEDIKKNTKQNFIYKKKKNGEYKGAKILGINIFNPDASDDNLSHRV